MFEVLDFWLARGVDGFRVDVIENLLEDEQLRDNPANPDFRPGMLPGSALSWVHSEDQPDNHDVVRGMRRVLDARPEKVLIGEVLVRSAGWLPTTAPTVTKHTCLSTFSSSMLRGTLVAWRI